MTENEARQMEVEIEWNDKANVCIHCGKVPETYYITTGHDHTDDSIRYCFCRSVASSIEQLTARVRELEAAHAAAVLNNQQLREALHYSLGAWHYDGVSDEHGSIFKEANDRCDTQPSTEALDAYVAEKVKEAKP